MCVAVATLGGQQAGDVPDGVSVGIEHESVRIHAEPFMVKLFFGQSSSTSGSAFYVALILITPRRPLAPGLLTGITSLSLSGLGL